MSVGRGIIATALSTLEPILIETLKRCGPALQRKLGCNPENLKRVEQYYIPVFAYLEQQLRETTTSTASPVIIGLSAPQGCGKTTLTESLRESFELTGKSCVSLSLDDFYLTGLEQEEKQRSHTTTALLARRQQVIKSSCKSRSPPISTPSSQLAINFSAFICSKVTKIQ